MPGTYTYTFSVVSDCGTTASATRQVIVYQTGLINAFLHVYDDLPNRAAALAAIEAYRNNTEVESVKCAEHIIRRLASSISYEFLPTDIRIAQVDSVDHIVEDPPGVYGVFGSVDIHVYYPPTIHRQYLLQAAAKKSHNSTASRSQLLHLQESASAAAAEPAGLFETTLKQLTGHLQQLQRAIDCSNNSSTQSGHKALPECSKSTTGRSLLAAKQSDVLIPLSEISTALENTAGASYVVYDDLTAVPVDYLAVRLNACLV